MKTSAEKMRALRERREREGFKRLDVWLHPDDYEQVKRLAAELSKNRKASKQSK